MTKTFVLVRHTAQDMRAAKTHTQDSMKDTVSIALQSQSTDYRKRILIGKNSYMSTMDEIDNHLNQLIVNIEEIRSEAKRFLSLSKN